MHELRAHGPRGCGKTLAAIAIAAQALLHGVGTGTLIMVRARANVRGMKGPHGRPDVCIADDLCHATTRDGEFADTCNWWRNAWTAVNPKALYFTFGHCP